MHAMAGPPALQRALAPPQFGQHGGAVGGALPPLHLPVDRFAAPAVERQGLEARQRAAEVQEERQAEGEGDEGGDVEAVADGGAHAAAVCALVRLLRRLRVARARKLRDFLPRARVPAQPPQQPQARRGGEDCADAVPGAQKELSATGILQCNTLRYAQGSVARSPAEAQRATAAEHGCRNRMVFVTRGQMHRNRCGRLRSTACVYFTTDPTPRTRLRSCFYRRRQYKRRCAMTHWSRHCVMLINKRSTARLVAPRAAPGSASAGSKAYGKHKGLCRHQAQTGCGWLLQLCQRQQIYGDGWGGEGGRTNRCWRRACRQGQTRRPGGA